MTLFNSTEKIGHNHLNGQIPVLEEIHNLKLNDSLITLYNRLLQTADDRILGKEFGRVHGTDGEWSRFMGRHPNEIMSALAELELAGLVQIKPEGVFISNYKPFVAGDKAKIKEFLAGK